MISRRSRSILIEAGAVAAPLIVLSGARLLLGSAPAGASAGGATPPAVTPAPLPQALSPEQERAAAWIRNLDPAASLNSPLDHPVAPVRIEKTSDPVPPPATIRTADPLAELTLTSVLGNDTGGLAMINGRIHKLGDRVKGMTITSIDPKENAVDLTTAAGGVVRLTRRPR